MNTGVLPCVSCDMDENQIATERPASLKHKFELTVEIDPFWIEYLTQCSDIFSHDRAGYWLRGVEHDKKLGWLCYEEGDEIRPHEDTFDEARKAWVLGNKLPNGWYRLDGRAALKAWEEGVKEWGIRWYGGRDHDANAEDMIVQLALLGENRYA